MATTVRWHQLTDRRYAEVLYFGLIDLIGYPTAEQHAAVGLACCAFVKGVADFQRYLHRTEADPPAPELWLQGSSDRWAPLVGEGLYHLLRAHHLDPAFRFPASVEPVTTEVMEDLRWFRREEFHDVKVDRDRVHHPREAALPCALVLGYLQGLSVAAIHQIVQFPRTVEELDGMLPDLLAFDTKKSIFAQAGLETT